MAKKNRKFRPLIEVEGGGHKLRSYGELLVNQGRAVIVTGKLRILDDQTNLGYNTAPELRRWAGRVSGGGPTVLQGLRD